MRDVNSEHQAHWVTGPQTYNGLGAADEAFVYHGTMDIERTVETF
jgi:hypothetical protein